MLKQLETYEHATDLIDDLLLVPGPTNLSARVREIMSKPQMSHSSAGFVESFQELLNLTRYVFASEKGNPFVITGSGTIGMEASVVSLLEPNDSVLVLDTGHFGNRFALMTEAVGCRTDVKKYETGRHAQPDDVEEMLSEGDYKAVFLSHVDTSTTIVNPIEEIVAVVKKYGAYAIVDSVCGLAGMKLNFDRLNADIVLTGSQKAIAAPPGAVLLSVSNQAIHAMENRKTKIPSFYFDLTRWKTVMDDPSIYLATPAVQIMMALKEAIQIVKEEGLERRWRRHHIIAEAFRSGLDKLGLGFVAEEGYRADTVTGFYIPEGKAAEVQSYMNKHGVILAGGLGTLKGKILRLGHFGNICPRDISGALTVLEMALRNVGHTVKLGSAVEAASIHLENLDQ